MENIQLLDARTVEKKKKIIGSVPTISEFKVSAVSLPAVHPLEERIHQTIKMRAAMRAEEERRKKIEDLRNVGVHENQKIKNPYINATDAKRRKLSNLFQIHGQEKSETWYANECTLTTITAARYLSKLKAGINITLPLHQKGRKKKVENEQYQSIVREKMKQNPLNTVRKIASELSNHGSPIGKSTIYRILTEKNKDTQKYPIFSFKRITKRESAANSEENKILRIKFIEKLNEYQMDGAMIFYIDETSWNVECVRKYGWSPVGEKVLIPPPPVHQSLTAITSISQSGMGYSEVIRGSINHEVFEAYIKRFLLSIKVHGSSVIVMDNASIHHLNTDAIIMEAGHHVLYNAAYSPILNPIENVFGYWKKRAEESSCIWKGENHFIAVLVDTFKDITAREVRRTIANVENEIWPLVLEKKDL
ncbi:putative transposase [Monocercomonoides exilis]|uniref:putative transposase n=1 Tax=Monocercomonoides exilis TaxID=2049356 RepID=UPI0035597445|nr:putative transposase [Monocercomonoides exilis]|eukprot:MONOS_12222.1-p1 / transcript=MONOS_12222.1 / gene=MONOS_12222 / organism=Monocercomonoides_exilis_PA203 / gene_product=unspecified product / transcript_product=unspecified product / location=Mono_scaffold00661:31729-32991(+) / protein_length=420 / sequence_SO=supercontig / SO=protein_coding / is_pseudo=false